jgi:hypothetical protein
MAVFVLIFNILAFIKISVKPKGKCFEIRH